MTGNGRGAVVAALALTVAVGSAAAQTVGTAVFEDLGRNPTARVVVALREPDVPATSLELRAGAVASIRDGVLARLDPAEFRLTASFQTISVIGGEVSLSGLHKLMADPDVVRVDLDVPVYANLAETVPLIKADQVHNKGFTGRGVVVAVLDTGVDETHPDLKDNLVAEQCFCTNSNGSGCCPNGQTQQSGAGAAKDEQGHGTNVTGIVTGAGRVAPLGVAPDSSVVAVRVLDKTGTASSTTQIMSGLEWVLTSRPDVKIVNLSLGTANLFPGICDNSASFTMGFAQVITALRNRGTLVFSSTANNANSTQIAVPACISTAVAVGATYDANVGSVTFGCTDATTAADRVACFSNSSSKVDLLAPGAALTAAGLGGGTSTFLGTSQACPTAAASAALLLQAKPSLTPDQIETAFKNSGVRIKDPRNGLTFPRIDVLAALAATP